MGKTVTRLDVNTKEFVANGTKYFIERPEDGFCLKRLQLYERYNIQFRTGVSGKDIYDFLANQIPMHVNNADLNSIAVKAYNIAENLRKLDEKYPIAYWFCTLFINTEDEDRTTYDQKLAEQKVKDWENEGIDTNFFLKLSISLLNGFKEDLMNALQENMKIADEMQ